MKIRIPAFFRHDLLRKLIALFFAGLIWLAVGSQLQESSIFHNVPVMLNYDPSAILVENVVPTVDVTLRGSSKRLQAVKASDIKVMAEIDIPSFAMPVYFYELRFSPENVKSPPGAHVIDISPSQQQIQIDRIVSKHNVPIRVRFSGQLAEGYKKTRCSPFPSAIDVRGPSRILKDIREFVTEPVVLDENVIQDFEVDIKLVQIPKVQANTDVHVSIEIARHSSQQAYNGLVMNVLSRYDSALQLSRDAPRVSVTLHGPKVTLDALDNLSIRPFVDITAITSPGRYRRPVQVWVDGAANVTAEYVDPSIVEIVLLDRNNSGKEKSADQPAPDKKQ